MYYVSAQGVDERIINVHYYYYTAETALVSEPSSVQYGMVSTRSEKLICAPPRLSQKCHQRCL